MARPEPLPRRPLVEIEWLDSFSIHGWHTEKETNRRAQACRSVGYLIEDAVDLVRITMSIGDDEVGDELVIPRSAIKRMRRVKL